jgi:PAS domain S-box-containing protein
MESELRHFVDALPGLVWTALPDGRADFFNQRWCEYTGMRPDEGVDHRWAAAVHPSDLPELIERWDAIRPLGQPGEFEARLRRFDGVHRRFLFSVAPLLDASGRITKWCAINTDIEERWQAEQAFHAGKQRSQAIADASTEIGDGEHTEALRAGEKDLLEMVATGQSMAEILNALCVLLEKAVEDCFCSVVLVDPTGTFLKIGAAPSLPESYVASLMGRTVSTGSSPCETAVRLREQVVAADLGLDSQPALDWRSTALAHGLRSWWSFPITSTAGRVLGALSIYHDEPRAPSSGQQTLIDQFTNFAVVAIEHAQNIAALKRSDEAQRLSLTGGFSWHLSTDELTWSDQVYRIFEIDPTDPATLELTRTRLHPEDVPGFLEMRLRQLDNVCDFEYDYRLVMPDQSIKYLHVVAHATEDEEGHPEYVAAVQDVTQRRLSDQALAKVRADLAHVARVSILGAMTASIAHEVNQPLSGILTNAGTCLRMLTADPPNVAGALETARRTIRDANRAADVITRLRALFSGKEAPTELVNLNEAALEVIALSRSDLQRNHVVVRVELDNGLPPVRGDRVQLQQVILNLILNASEAMSGVGDHLRLLVIRTEQNEDESVNLIVQDTGTGFSTYEIEQLFGAFFTTKSTGMGIGLSVSRTIIERHHGRLWAAPNDGPGVSFSFSIPSAPRETGDLGYPIGRRTSAAPDAEPNDTA